MSDEAVAALLRSDQPLVLVEAAAGCGKTYQGARYARDAMTTLGDGRLLILTHTHAACSVFAERTKGAGSRVEIKTIDALIMQISTAYHQALGLPPDLSSWAWRDNGSGFSIMAAKVAAFLGAHPMVAKALATRYQVIVCDEHQDSSADQHEVVMSLHRGGAMLRIFGDPLQRIYGGRTAAETKADQARWEALKQAAACDVLDTPHRWQTGCAELGEWIRSARESMKANKPIDLARSLPDSLTILRANNVARQHGGYSLSKDQRRPIDQLVNRMDQLMILASQNDLVSALRGFWMRKIPIWEGHSRDALAGLVAVLREKHGNAEGLAQGLIEFVSTASVGFTQRSHGDRLLQEIREGCIRKTTGKPANIQAIARLILGNPSPKGVSDAIGLIRDLVKAGGDGFSDVKIDHRVELGDAIRLGVFADAEEGFAEIARRRSYSRPSPPSRTLSSIHKAKGLECDHVMVMACDRTQFSATSYAKCKLYVAISRAKRSLTLVIPDTNTSPLFET
ncbi:UvrD-helicase domain-containing protein [Pseudoxanthomonas sp. LH2527]|uniref:UvrD-helicase domain-containing protein n=1 Tax=Pseudoxanthomonas sp. LH2527 TaxID=2923249 RepID=UPI001F13F4A4|nr:UvrD-helicase domain-containing protein [Pseudoxanthomonas sp. LH2527]MCH6482462.1 UvrD-helicase domain-containing protein [Pseudoxanthomonas sp. LH2527]